MTDPRSIGFLGPLGTFHEEALLTQPDLAALDLRPMSSIADVLVATEAGDLDLGFTAIENSIEGTVNVTLDTLAFEADLLIQREVVINISLNLLAPAGTSLDDITSVVSFPHAVAQCRGFLSEKLPGVKALAANSTADAARRIGSPDDDEVVAPGTAAIGTHLAAKLYGLEIIAEDIEDHPENQTRFVLTAKDAIPAATGHDKTTIVCFQRSDRPGSLLSILQEFAARAINLTKLESRPTKQGLGDYCFIIDMEGHISDELVADALRDLHSKQGNVKFLGSYPAAGDHGPGVRREASSAWREADTWLSDLRGMITRD